MNPSNSTSFWLILSFVSYLTSCGSGSKDRPEALPENPRCRDDQVWNDTQGQCLPKPAVSCGPAENLKDGQCTPIAQPLPPSTPTQQSCLDKSLSLNQEKTQCVTPSAAECLTRELTLRDGRCQKPELPPPPTDAMCMEQGLTLNQEKTQCVTPTAEACQTRGQVLKDDRCQSLLPEPGPTERECLDQGLIFDKEESKCATPTEADCQGRGLIFQNGLCQPPRSPIQVRKMAILGDSIATGILSNTELGQSIGVTFSLSRGAEIDLGDGILVKITNILDISEETVIEKIQALSATYKKRASAFFGGTDLSIDEVSHARKLGLKTTDVHHLAQVGHRIENVLEDIANNENKLQAVDYIVLEVGSNDFCSGTRDLSKLKIDFKKSLEQIVERLQNLASQPVVLVVPIPDIPGSLAKIKDVEAFKLAGRSIQCQTLQKAYCPRVEMPLDEQVKLRNDLNAIITDVVGRSTRPDHFVLHESIATASFDQEDFSADCFHPGKKGHKRISELSFGSVQGLFVR